MMKYFFKFWRSKFNIPRRVFWKTDRILNGKFNLFGVSSSFQNSQMKEIGLIREDGLAKLDDVLNDVMSKSYNENDGMFSEHLILISAISVSRANIKRVLEIGTHDGGTALILSHLFPDAEIISIDLPSDDSVFEHTYNRDSSVDEFINTRDANIAEAKNVDFREVNSIGLCEWNEKFDLIWIDGAHGYPVVPMDVINSFRLANKGAFILIDDIWKSVDISDGMYKSIAGIESLDALVSAKLIPQYFLFHKRLGGVFNYPGQQKYVGLLVK
jgi:predicted O-methyltransferase YrrM